MNFDSLCILWLETLTGSPAGAALSRGGTALPVSSSPLKIVCGELISGHTGPLCARCCFRKSKSDVTVFKVSPGARLRLLIFGYSLRTLASLERLFFVWRQESHLLLLGSRGFFVPF